MTLYNAACGPSKIGIGGKFSGSIPKGDIRTKEVFASNQAILKQLGQAQLQGDWIKYEALRSSLIHA